MIRHAFRSIAAAIAVMATLTAATCDTKPDPQPLVAGIQIVEVPGKPTPIPCVKATDIPAAVTTSMPDPDTSDIGQLAAGASADVKTLKGDNAKLRATLIACTQLPTTAGEVKP